MMPLAIKLNHNLNQFIIYFAAKKTTIETSILLKQRTGEKQAMSDLNRGIMKFDGADSPKVVTISTVLLLGSIAALIIWALQSAYAVN
jgi:hypothetical protein